MSFFKAIPIIGDIIEDALGIIDKKVEDKDKANELKALIKKSLIEKLSIEWQHITSRWISDNDHLISRLIRPSSYAYMLILFTAVAFLDSSLKSFSLKPEYIDIVKALLLSMTYAYFGGRSAEKIIRLLKGGKK